MLPKGPDKDIKALLEGTYTEEVKSKVGDYAGVYGFAGYDLVSSTDGVGTKLYIPCLEEWPTHAQKERAHECIGQDLVNHCVNDLLVTGAQPMFFLNTFTYSHHEGKVWMDSVFKGMAEAAREHKMPIISGETAKLEGMMPPNLYDLTGTIVGWVSPSYRITGENVKTGDSLIGLRSHGLHTNGFTTIRRIFCSGSTCQDAREAWTETVDTLGMSVRDAVMRPHRSYYKIVRPMLYSHKINAIAHVTGGGMTANLLRVLNGHKPVIKWTEWEWPPLFGLIKNLGRLSDDQMEREFNLGIGMVLVVPNSECVKTLGYLKTVGENPVYLGSVV